MAKIDPVMRLHHDDFLLIGAMALYGTFLARSELGLVDQRDVERRTALLGTALAMAEQAIHRMKSQQETPLAEDTPALQLPFRPARKRPGERPPTA